MNSGGLERLHLGQILSSFVPHFPQKLMPSGFSSWHLGHFILFLLKRQVEMPSQRKTSPLKEVQGENARPPSHDRKPRLLFTLSREGSQRKTLGDRQGGQADEIIIKKCWWKACSAKVADGDFRGGALLTVHSERTYLRSEPSPAGPPPSFCGRAPGGSSAGSWPGSCGPRAPSPSSGPPRP